MVNHPEVRNTGCRLSLKLACRFTGANGARIRLAPQMDWDVNNPAELAKVLNTLEGIQADFNDGQRGNKRVSMADLIVLGGADHGVFTQRPGTLSTDFFVNLLDMGTQWQPSAAEGVYEGRDRATNELRWTATPVDLVFGSHAELRAISELYAAAEGHDRFVRDFVDAWTKVMTLDRFGVAAPAPVLAME